MNCKNSMRKRVFEYVLEKYGTSPEYLWKSFPEYAVLRHSKNKKWYGVVMNVSGDKLSLESEKTIDIIELKCSPLMKGSVLSDGILPAYHMNKNHWISVLLDGTLTDKQVFSLIDMSYSLTE